MMTNITKTAATIKLVRLRIRIRCQAGSGFDIVFISITSLFTPARAELDFLAAFADMQERTDNHIGGDEEEDQRLDDVGDLLGDAGAERHLAGASFPCTARRPRRD